MLVLNIIYLAFIIEESYSLSGESVEVIAAVARRANKTALVQSDRNAT